MAEAAAHPIPVIAIDGPGAAGKGTICNRVASALGWTLLDSGALYRLVGLAALRKGVEPDDATALAELARGLDIEFLAGDEVVVLLDGQDVSREIRTEHAGLVASKVAAQSAVRSALIERQREFRRPPGLVADGRDMGSVVFPSSALKIFLTANVTERAQRRYKQLKDKGIDVSLSALSKDMVDRDRQDTDRSVAPLITCADARILDTTSMSIEEVVCKVLEWAKEVYPQGCA
ncbi:MAG: (d)CMP kinase [Gammaproteobacteria bacterium]|nr:(d)CMP kinase [Gammaproteobacteria bacterium]